MTDFLNKIISNAKSAQSDRIINQAAKEKRNRLLPSFTTYQGIDPIDGTDKVMINGETNSGFNLISNASLSIGERVFLRPNQSGGLQRVDARNVAPVVPVPVPVPIFPEGSETVIFFSEDRLFTQIDGLEENLSFASTIFGSSGIGYGFLDSNPAVIRYQASGSESAIGDYSAIVSTSFPSGDLTGYISFLADPPYTVWKVELNCQDGYALTPSCDPIELNGFRIEVGATYELQGIAGINGGDLVDFNTLASAVAVDNGIGGGSVQFDISLNTINTIGEGDATLSCAVIGLTTVEWAWKWRKQGEDWFVL
jgi:hypothetical protein